MAKQERPEYVYCVMTGYGPLHADANKTWCDVSDKHLTEAAFRGFKFGDPTHAILNARNQGRLLMCPECAAAMIKTIQSGTWDGVPDPDPEAEG